MEKLVKQNLRRYPKVKDNHPNFKEKTEEIELTAWEKNGPKAGKYWSIEYVNRKTNEKLRFNAFLNKDKQGKQPDYYKIEKDTLRRIAIWERKDSLYVEIEKI